MRVSSELLSVPIALGGRDSNRRLRHLGTAFLVGYPTQLHPVVGSTALVTARQTVLRSLEEYANVWVRLNIRNGPARDVEVTARWQYPEDSAVDVAAAPFYPPASGQLLQIATSRFVTSDIVAAGGVAAGDDLVVVSMLPAHGNAERMRPILRRGSLASLPLQQLGDPQRESEPPAYLAEIRTRAELGGSPVFVVPDAQASLRVDDDRAAGTPQHCLLGLMQGQDLDDEHGKDTGIALVTPASELLALFQRRAFVDFGRNMDRVRARETSVELVGEHPAREARSSDFERFEDLTRKLVNVPKTEIDEKRSRQL